MYVLRSQMFPPQLPPPMHPHMGWPMMWPGYNPHMPHMPPMGFPPPMGFMNPASSSSSSFPVPVKREVLEYSSGEGSSENGISLFPIGPLKGVECGSIGSAGPINDD